MIGQTGDHRCVGRVAALVGCELAEYLACALGRHSQKSEVGEEGIDNASTWKLRCAVEGPCIDECFHAKTSLADGPRDPMDPRGKEVVGPSDRDAALLGDAGRGDFEVFAAAT